MKSRKTMISLLITSILTLVISINTYGLALCNFSLVDSKEDPRTMCEQTLLTMLTPYIRDVVKKHYGVERQFDLFDAQVISIKKVEKSFEFYIVVQVYTFTGAHNPPNGTETITIKTMPEETKVVEFNHKPE